MKFRFLLQTLLDERVREEKAAYAAFASAQATHRQACRSLRATEAASAACDRSTFIVLDVLERARILRRREAEEKRAAQERARVAFENARGARMQLTILRERAYGAYLEEEERREMRESEERNALPRLRLLLPVVDMGS